MPFPFAGNPFLLQAFLALMANIFTFFMISNKIKKERKIRASLDGDVGVGLGYFDPRLECSPGSLNGRALDQQFCVVEFTCPALFSTQMQCLVRTHPRCPPQTDGRHPGPSPIPTCRSRPTLLSWYLCMFFMIHRWSFFKKKPPTPLFV